MGGAEGSARAELAARLNALREGSGRTYASLARRVGVSGSTLHRYCTGRTVPAEFAPVERLARWCGASAADRAELHRLWTLADGERPDRRPGEAATAGPAAEPVRAAGPALSPGPPPGAVVTGPDDVAYGEGAPEPPERSGAGPRGADGEPSGPHAGAASGPAGTGRSAASSRAGASRGPVSRPGRALGVLTAAGLALALVATLGRSGAPGPDRGPSAAAGSPGGRPPVASAAPPAGPTAAGTAGRASGPVPRGLPSGGARQAVPEGAEPRSEASPALPEGSRPPGGGGGAPFTWTADGHVWKNSCDHSYLVDRAPAAVPPPPVEADAASWAGALGAVHGGETGVRVTLQGRDERAVVLESLRIRVVERRPAARGRVYRMSSGCGGALTPRMFDVDLDVPRPLARPVPGNDSGRPVEAVSFPYRVSATDPEVLLITARTGHCDCDWFAELAWSGGGRSGTVRVDDRGRPFRTSGVPGRRVHDYDTFTGRWGPVAEDAEPGG